MSREGAIHLPNDDESRSDGIAGRLKQARTWFNNKWNGDSNERSPLLSRDVEDPQAAKRKTKFRAVVIGSTLLIALVILGASIGYWFKHHDKEIGGKIIAIMRETF